MVPKLTEKQRNLQIKKEALISLGLYAAFFVWWLVTGYGLGSGDPAEYSYVFGIPMWFFLSSIMGYILFSIAAIVTVKLFFKDFDLDETADQEGE